MQSAFNLDKHALFFAILEIVGEESEAEAAFTPNSCCMSENKVHTILLKLRASMTSIYHKHPKISIGSLLQAWCDFDFSKEEKDSIAYFQTLQHRFMTTTLTSLEYQLSELLFLRDTMNATLEYYPDHFSPFYLKHGSYLIDLYIHKKMERTLPKNCSPILANYVQTYLTIARKKLLLFITIIYCVNL